MSPNCDPGPWLVGLEQFQQDQSPAGVTGVPVIHGCNVTWPCLIPELSVGTLSIPGELHPCR